MIPDSISGPAGALQIMTEMPVPGPRALAVICHPHPLHGGSLNNKIVHQLARTFTAMGAVSVRFNFRGVGNSDGEYDEGVGELEDLLAVIDWAQGRWPDMPLWLGGFSFGGFIAAQAAAIRKPVRLVTVAPAVNYFPESALNISSVDWLLIQGGSDDVVPAEDVKAWSAALPHPPTLVMIEGAGHFFHGRLNDLKNAVLERFPDT